MSHSYNKIGIGRAHYREYGANIMKRYSHKKLRGRIKAMRDEEGSPILPVKIGVAWGQPILRKWGYCSENIISPDDFKLPLIGKKLERIRKYDLIKEDIKFIYHMKSK